MNNTFCNFRMYQIFFSVYLFINVSFVFKLCSVLKLGRNYDGQIRVSVVTKST